MAKLQIPALGRHFTLGMLYDALEDQIIPSMHLWDKESLQEETTEEPFTDFEVCASDSSESKSSQLENSSSLKASILCGLVKVDGSAKYLNDKKESHNQSRVTFRYKCTTNFKALTNQETLEPQLDDFISKGCATHVVTGIKYGAEAYFVFDSEKVETSRVKEIGGKMEAVLNKISVGCEGQVDMKLTKEEKSLTEQFSCKFYGDVRLTRNPTKFAEAVEAFAELPNMVGDGVPMEVSLMPLTVYNHEAAELKSEISPGLVNLVEEALEDLSDIGMRCNDCLADKVVENITHTQKELKTFRDYVDQYETKLKKTMAEIFPSIRAGKENESRARQFFDERGWSPFSNAKLSEWMEDKEKEINVMGSCVAILGGIKIVQDKAELDSEVLALGADNVLCYVFTYSEGRDHYFEEMKDYLYPPECQVNSAWCNVDKAVKDAREMAEVFQDAAKALKNDSRFRFLIAALPNPKYIGATIYQYREGILENEHFTKPDPPDVETITDRKDLIWYATDLTLDEDTANRHLTLSEENKKATCELGNILWHFFLPGRPERFDTHPQVLCKEGLNGRHYWEVEMSNGLKESVFVGVAYEGVERIGEKSQLGSSTESWAFGRFSEQKWLPFGAPPKKSFKAMHDGSAVWEMPLPSTGCKKLGVFLDWAAGTLSFYSVSSNTLSHLYTFHTTFTKPVHPGLWVYHYANHAYLNLAE